MLKQSLAAAVLAASLLPGARTAEAQFMSGPLRPGSVSAAQLGAPVPSEQLSGVPGLVGRTASGSEVQQLITPVIRSQPPARPDFLNAPYEGTSRPPPPSALLPKTEFQEEYDMPWLYGLAGLTSLGRVVERKHWVSDTVGGAILGYAVGRALWSSNRDPKRRGPEITFTGRSVQARWEFD